MLCTLFKECVNADYINTDCCVSYALRRCRDELRIFFEASNGISDWIRNLDFPVRAYKRSGTTAWLAHRGFLKAWREVEPMLSKEIADSNIQKIVLIGYSHGAAIALLCHEYVWFTRPDLRSRLEGYGFGCPRVIWGSPSTEIRRRWENFTVIRNIDDAVTHLPPSSVGYIHVGKMLEIGKRGKYSAINAHRPQNYEAELEAYEKKSE